MHFRRQSRDTDSVNLTPLIDVVFLLLIFFMVSTTFTEKTQLSIELPQAVGEARAEDAAEPLEIVISSEGAYSVNGRSLINNRSSTLRTALEDAAAGDTQQRLIITADAQSPHESVVRAMDAAGQLGLHNLSITTRHPESGD